MPRKQNAMSSRAGRRITALVLGGMLLPIGPTLADTLAAAAQTPPAPDKTIETPAGFPVGNNAFGNAKTCQAFDPLERYGDQLLFQIRRNDAPVGRHVLRFYRNGNGLKVVARSNIDISFLGLSLYRFAYRSESLWQDGKLSALSVDVDDDGEQIAIAASRESGQLTVKGPDGILNLPSAIFPTDHWHCGVLASTTILNTLTGKPNNVRIREGNIERLQTVQGSVQATHFAYDGDLETNAWYDRDGRWVGLQFTARDGSDIIYRCINCVSATGQKDRG